jgi:hypothetical protein
MATDGCMHELGPGRLHAAVPSRIRGMQVLTTARSGCMSQYLRARKWRTVGRPSHGGYLCCETPPEIVPEMAPATAPGGAGGGGGGSGGGVSVPPGAVSGTISGTFSGGVSVRSHAALCPDRSAVMSTVCTLRPSGEVLLETTILPRTRAQDGAGASATSPSGAPNTAPPMFDETSICLRTGMPGVAGGKFLDCDRTQVRRGLQAARSSIATALLCALISL